MTDTATERAVRLAAEPLREAGPRPGFASGTLTSLRDIADHRELMGFLVRRELKSRYKDSALGFFWSLIRPLAMLLIYYIALGKFLGAARSIPDFAIFIYTGLTAWTLFNEIVTIGTASIVANSGLVKKVYLPREVFPLSVVGSAIFNFFIQVGILLAATMAVGRFPTGTRWLYFPLSLTLLLVFATALALLLSAVNVYLRDTQHFLELALLAWFWVTPIVYAFMTIGRRPGGWFKYAWMANPVTPIVLIFQRAIYARLDNPSIPVGSPGHEILPHWGMAAYVGYLGYSLAFGIIMFAIGIAVFGRSEANFAEEL